MFPKDKRMFSSSHNRNVDRVQAVSRRFTLSTKLIVTSLFVFAYQGTAPYHKGLLIRMVVEQEPKILNDRTTSMQVRMGY
jgi:hypothetical protein